MCVLRIHKKDEIVGCRPIGTCISFGPSQLRLTLCYHPRENVRVLRAFEVVFGLGQGPRGHGCMLCWKDEKRGCREMGKYMNFGPSRPDFDRGNNQPSANLLGARFKKTVLENDCWDIHASYVKSQICL